ncbi:hypothetical protein [Micrococcus sp. IITD107]|uniref:AMIN-like domain-containing (lipo)protein n=1 Tax=Micrococcus sp. IITD107 TaxID=3342790 RepID=UPI0035B7787B
MTLEPSPRSKRRRRLHAAATAVVLACSAGAFAPASAAPVAPAAQPTAVTTGTAAATPYCGVRWGSLPETRSGYSSATIRNVRAGRHACFDRMVIDVKGQLRGYDVRYAPVYREGSGAFVPLLGAADLRITVKAPAYDQNGRATYTPRSPNRLVDVTGYSTFRQIALAGSFEGQTTFGLGVRARLPFRTFVLPQSGGVSRLVIDVAHRW